MKLRWIMLCVLAIAIPSSFASAQTVSVKLIVPTQQLEVGEAVDVKFVCKNTGAPESPKGFVPEGLELKLLNSSPSTKKFTQIINGRRSVDTSYSFAMRLTAKKAGSYTLGPLSVDVNGRIHESNSVTITVRNVETDDRADGERYVFARIEVSKTSLYVTETLTATLTFGIREISIDGRRYDLNMLRDVLDLRSSQLSVFEGGQATRSSRSLPDRSGQRHRYEVFRVVKAIRAEQIGELSVGPVFLKANYPTALRRGWFGSPEISRSRRETARTNSIVVTVLAPPELNRPDSYTGAVGYYALSVSAIPTEVSQGQPVTLTIAIAGNPVEGVAGPDLTRIPELVSRFEFSGEELVGDLEAGAKVFRRALFPKQAGDQPIPPVEWSYFDPGLERYVTLTSQPIALQVTQREAPTTAIVIPDSPNFDPNTTELRVLMGGISPNYADANAVLANQTFALTTPWLVSMIAAPLSWLVILGVTTRRRRLREDVSWARQRGARRRALAHIRKALPNSDAAQQQRELASAITGYLSDRFNLSSSTLTPIEVATLLESHGVEAGVCDQIVSFLESCDAAQYAPGTDGEWSGPEAAAELKNWVKHLESLEA